MSQTDRALMGASTIPCEDVNQSSLYTMIPSVVRSRIPVLTSLRHSAKAVVFLAAPTRKKAFTFSCVDISKERESPSGFAATVPPSGASTPMLGPESLDSNICPRELSLKMLPQIENRSGVDWEVAATGGRLCMAARAQAEQGGDPSTLRSMQIDALRYMHMALPPDLTSLEVESLRASMGPQLIVPSGEARDGHGQPPPNALRQVIAQAVCWLFASLLLFLPLLMTLLNRVLQFERHHQVTERVITNSLDMTSSLGERGLELHNAFLRFKEGRVGSAFVDFGSWLVEGIAGGLSDGLDEVSRSRKRASLAL
ncbi:hypothetical protein HRR83_003682 [Exophiala dermatitidis]|nr:hypothetical protein HRR75_002688 [Exophiala dermatitidis]KAJ4522352.1 hypothetical protein HRR74_002937 [Exophiala dermatitidis]KAJ4529677.1 hypothetical protein HRR73_000705 [Exophiala dermatitidis]KAJ4543160.1 hypothetical protein HRR77_005415 [Exophiala dermatitidis]KAJ4543659.1 hypothetical protein HRR76_001723 [Exophiala dermatitidis]